VLGVGERMEQLVHVGAAARGAGGVGDHEHQLRRSPFGKPRIRAGWPCRIPRCSRSNRWDSQARGRRGASGKGGEEGGDGPKGAAFRPRPWKGSSASFPRRLRARGSAEGGKASPRHCAANGRLLAQSLRFGKLWARTDTARVAMIATVHRVGADIAAAPRWQDIPTLPRGAAAMVNAHSLFSHQRDGVLKVAITP
jgi:hypothetical protein